MKARRKECLHFQIEFIIYAFASIHVCFAVYNFILRTNYSLSAIFPVSFVLKNKYTKYCFLHLLLIYLKHLNLLDFTSASVVLSRPTLKTKQYSSENFLKTVDHTKVVIRSHKSQDRQCNDKRKTKTKRLPMVNNTPHRKIKLSNTNLTKNGVNTDGLKE